eukprot:3336927-Prymnesium_polylepis.2
MGLAGHHIGMWRRRRLRLATVRPHQRPAWDRVLAAASTGGCAPPGTYGRTQFPVLRDGDVMGATRRRHPSVDCFRARAGVETSTDSRESRAIFALRHC